MMKHRNNARLSATAALILLLSGCGKDSPPETYAVEADSLPALNTLVTLDEGYAFSSEQAGEDGAASYVYSGLASGAQTASAYAQALETDNSCVLLTADGSQRAGEDAFSADSGEVLLAEESESGQGLFELSLQWDATSCTVTPSYAQDAALPSDNPDMTLDEAVTYLQSFSPAALGLDGESMSEYSIFPEDGVAMLDEIPCICLNVYALSDHQYRGTYLITGQGDQVYQLDRDTGTATPLFP